MAEHELPLVTTKGIAFISRDYKAGVEEGISKQRDADLKIYTEKVNSLEARIKEMLECAQNMNIAFGLYKSASEAHVKELEGMMLTKEESEAILSMFLSEGYRENESCDCLEHKMIAKLKKQSEYEQS